MIYGVTDNHDKFLKHYAEKFFEGDSFSSNIISTIHKVVDTCKEIEEFAETSSSKKDSAILVFTDIYKRLCHSLLSNIEAPKLAAIDNPLDDLPPKPKNNILAKANALAKNVHPKMVKLFKHMPKAEKLILLTSTKELSHLMETLRIQADKHYRKQEDAWFVLYAFTLLADNITSAMRESLR